MKKVLSHVGNNPGRYFTVFTVFLNIVGIITVFKALKTNQYDNPLLIVVVEILNLFWFLFLFYAPVPEQKLFTENKETDIKANSNKYIWLVDMLKIMYVDILKVASIFTLLIITIIIELCLKYSGRVH